MQPQTIRFLALSMVIAAALILLAVLVSTFSPMLWTDHMINDRLTRQGISQSLPAGCSIQTQSLGGGGFIAVAHCPAWVQLS